MRFQLIRHKEYTEVNNHALKCAPILDKPHMSSIKIQLNFLANFYENF